jgi:N-methylhydantoinase A
MCLLPASETSVPAVEALFERLELQARERLAGDGVTESDMQISRAIDMRYAGQWRQLTVTMEKGETMAAALKAFHSEHERAFAFRDEDRVVEVYAARVVAIGQVPKPPSSSAVAGTGELPAAIGRRQVFFSEVDGYVDTPVYRREDLMVGNMLTGPAIVEQLDSTVVLSPGTTSTVTADRHIVTRFTGGA